MDACLPERPHFLQAREYASLPVADTLTGRSFVVICMRRAITMSAEASRSMMISPSRAIIDRVVHTLEWRVLRSDLRLSPALAETLV